MHSEILRRLDIIKNAVAMEEEDLVAMQMQKLEPLPVDERVRHILELIRNRHYQDVIQLIEQYKHDSTGLSVYEDPQIQGLKLELKVLENSLNELTDTQAELERQINAFNSEYMRRLGGLIEEILRRRADLSDDAAEQQAAQQDYEEFQRSHQQQLHDAPQSLTPAEQQQLKSAYRKASRLCHPDKLDDAFKAEGETFFKALNEAYRRQDIQRVSEILHTLETGATLSAASDSLNDKAALQAKIAALRNTLARLEADIQRLQADETYQRIQAITDRESYFTELEQALRAELAVLRGDG